MAENITVNNQYFKWKSSIPFLYDWFTNHNSSWPSITVRWGNQLEENKFKRRVEMYLSERTGTAGKKKAPNKLMVVPVDILKPRIATADPISGFNETTSSDYVGEPTKSIIHPGEVNKVRELPANTKIVATHSDSNEIYLWNFDRQPNRVENRSCAKVSVPDLTLVGHEEDAQFALSTHTSLVASGGQDSQVLVWDVNDYESGAMFSTSTTESQNPTLLPKYRLKGHTNTVEEVVFNPVNQCELMSVGDDYSVLLWDTRVDCPSISITNAHGHQDVQCADWSSLDDNIIATGAADGSLKIWDRRVISESLYDFKFHTRGLLRIEWANYRPGILASGGEDGVISVWDLNHTSTDPNANIIQKPEGRLTKTKALNPPQLMFQHCGHRSQVMDFQWLPSEPFTMASISDDGRGGTMQIWRILDLIHRPMDEALLELNKFKNEIFGDEGRQNSDELDIMPTSNIKDLPTGGALARPKSSTAPIIEIEPELNQSLEIKNDTDLPVKLEREKEEIASDSTEAPMDLS